MITLNEFFAPAGNGPSTGTAIVRPGTSDRLLQSTMVVTKQPNIPKTEI